MKYLTFTISTHTNEVFNPYDITYNNQVLTSSHKTQSLSQHYMFQVTIEATSTIQFEQLFISAYTKSLTKRFTRLW